MASKKKVVPQPLSEPESNTGETDEVLVGADTPRRRGRPKGSKNKPKDGLLSRRGPGRPKGSGKASNGVESDLGERIDAMISELEAIRAEVTKLEQVRSVLRELQEM